MGFSFLSFKSGAVKVCYPVVPFRHICTGSVTETAVGHCIKQLLPINGVGYGGWMDGWMCAVSLCCFPPAPQLAACSFAADSAPPHRLVQ